MKKIATILAGALIIALIPSCKKENSGDSSEVNNLSTTYKALVINVTATWCHYCGTSGVQAFDKVFTDYPYQVVGIGVHSADDISVSSSTTAVNKFKSSFGISGIPAFVVNSTKSQYAYSTVNADLNAALLATTTAKAGIGLAKVVSGSVITVKYKVKAFSDYADGMKLAIYALKHDIVNDQTYDKPSGGQDQRAWTHNYVFMGTPDGDFSDIWGTTLSASTIAKNTEFEGEARFTVPEGVDAESLTFAGVLWSSKTKGTAPTIAPNEMINSNIIERPSSEQ